ncbi:MAG: ATP-binding protein [Phycisphaerales bacterium]|jgi:serine/threonine-protein kinase RsbW|nr:ATP-binding protein [Planctomycetota bacterium]
MTETPLPFESTASFGPEADGLADFEATLDAALEAHGYSESELFAIRLAVEEAVANGINHGNRRDPNKRVALTCRVDSSEVFVVVEDEGEGFDPGAVPDPTDEANIEIPSGRGLMLMGAYMSDVRYVPPGNRVEMTYRRGTSE